MAKKKKIKLEPVDFYDEPSEVTLGEDLEVDEEEKPIKKSTKKSTAKEPEVEQPGGCEACGNTGLDRSKGLTEAQVCPVCDGSPFEPRNKQTS